MAEPHQQAVVFVVQRCEDRIDGTVVGFVDGPLEAVAGQIEREVLGLVERVVVVVENLVDQPPGIVVGPIDLIDVRVGNAVGVVVEVKRFSGRGPFAVGPDGVIEFGQLLIIRKVNSRSGRN